MKKATTAVLADIAMLAFSADAMAQAAGAGADYNRQEAQRLAQERARQQAFDAEVRRLEQIDKPLQNDPLGNALIGGGVNTLAKGLAAGATSVATGSGTATVIQTITNAMSGDSASSATTGDSE